MLKRARLGICLILALFLVGVLLTVQPAVAKVTLKLWCMSFPPHVNGFTKVAEAFTKKNPNIDVKVEGQADLMTKQKAGIAAGVVGDLFMLRGEDFLEYALAKSVAPLSPDVVTVKEVKEKWWPEYILQAPFDNIYAIGIPDPIGDAGFVVNVNMFNEAGLEVPGKFKSIDELLTYAEKLKKKDAQGNLIRAGLSCREYNNQVFLWDFIAEQGGHFYDNEKKQFNYNIPEAQKALQFFYDLHWKYEVDSIKLPDSFNALSQQVAAMAFMWAEYVPFSKINYPESNFSFVVKPAFVEGKDPYFSHVDSWNLAAYAKTRYKKEAFAYLKFLKTPEAQRIFFEENPGISPLKELINDPFYETEKGKFLKALTPFVPNMKFWGPFGNDSIIKESLYKIMDAVEHQTMTVEQGLKEMTDQSNHAMNLFREKYPKFPKVTIQY
ncbi:MAG: ABC transporter substrate-binding protein [bacterium]